MRQAIEGAWGILDMRNHLNITWRGLLQGSAIAIGVYLGLMFVHWINPIAAQPIDDCKSRLALLRIEIAKARTDLAMDLGPGESAELELTDRLIVRHYEVMQIWVDTAIQGCFGKVE